MGTPGGPSEAHVESGFTLAHPVVYSTGLSPGIPMEYLWDIYRVILYDILDARDTMKSLYMPISILYVYVYARGPCSVPFCDTMWIGVYYTMCGCVYTYMCSEILCDLLFFYISIKDWDFY